MFICTICTGGRLAHPRFSISQVRTLSQNSTVIVVVVNGGGNTNREGSNKASALEGFPSFFGNSTGQDIVWMMESDNNLDKGFVYALFVHFHVPFELSFSCHRRCDGTSSESP